MAFLKDILIVVFYITANSWCWTNPGKTYHMYMLVDTNQRLLSNLMWGNCPLLQNVLFLTHFAEQLANNASIPKKTTKTTMLLSQKYVSSREQQFQVIPVSLLSMIPGKLFWSRQLWFWFIAVKFSNIEVPWSCRRSWNNYELEHKHGCKWCHFPSIHSSSTVYSRFHRLQHSKVSLPLSSTLKTVTGRWYFGLEHVTEFKYELNWVICKSMFCHSMFKIGRLGLVH